MKRISHILSLLLILGLVFVSFNSLVPKNISTANTPKDQFATERALEHLKVITKEAHYIGTAAHDEVRKYLVSTLESMGLQPQVQEGFVYSQWFGYGHLVKPKNILARIKGSGDGSAVLVMSHYDSAPNSKSKGASDAGSGVVAVLESIRAFKESGEQPVNDIIILFTDAEEVGLDGASLFVNEHPWAKDAKVALNFEARGSGGPSNMIIETNHGNSALIKAFKDANPAYPVATSLMYSIYKLLPNDTDSTVLREDGDIDGYFFAFIDDHYDYHTVNDNYDNLDRASLEHQGSYLMPLLSHFATANLNEIESNSDDVYFDTAVFTFLSYPFSYIWPMVVLAILLFLVLIVYGIRKGVLKGRVVGKGFLCFLGTLIGGGGLLYCLWELIKVAYPQYGDMLPIFIYNGQWYTLFFVFLVLAITFGIYSKFTKVNETANLMVAPLTIWLLINIAIAIYLKGAAYFIIPVYFTILLFYLQLKQTNAGSILATLLCAPAIFILAPLVQFLPVGLGPDMYIASVLCTVLIAGLLLPVIGNYRSKRLLSISCLGVALVLFAVAHATASYDENHQKPNSLIYYQNSDTQKSYWATYDARLDSWTSAFLGENPEQASTLIGNAAGSKYNTGYSFAKETKTISIPPSLIVVDTDTLMGNQRKVTLTIHPREGVHQIRLYADRDIPFGYLEYNGQIVTPDSTETLFKKRRSRGMLSYYLSAGDSLRMRYTVPRTEEVHFTLKEYSYNLFEHPSLEVAPREESMMPRPFVTNDAIITERTFNPSELKPLLQDTLIINSIE